MFTVTLSRKADKFHRRMDEGMQHRVADFLLTLQEDPVPKHAYDITKLTNSDSSYRTRIGDYRIIYTVLWQQKEIEVSKIERKKDRTYK